MPRKTSPDLLSTALAELEQIVEQLNLDNDDLSDALSEAEIEMTNLESGADLKGLKNNYPA
jgi:exonuclease VII small subunit